MSHKKHPKKRKLNRIAQRHNFPYKNDMLIIWDEADYITEEISELLKNL